MSDWNKKVIEEFRANEGKVGGNFANMKLLLLHTTGAKTDLERVNPLVCMADGERFVIIASKAGAPSHPDWYYNIIANSSVSVEVGTEQFKAKATVVEEPERTELYDKIASINTFFDEYRQKTTRIIPVIALTRSA